MLILFVLYFFLSSALVISSLFVVLSNNPVYSLLWLVVSFVLSSCLLLISGCEFLALIFLVVYVGAIAVLFLFVVMLLDLKFKDLSNKKNYSFISILFFGDLLLVSIIFSNLFYFRLKNLGIKHFDIFFDKTNFNLINWSNFFTSANQTSLYGIVFYDIFVIQFLLIGIILLAVLIGVIFLTNLYRSHQILDQSIFKQISATSSFFSHKN